MNSVQGALVGYTNWILAAHIIAVITWMAGMLYLPRLFVYHTQTKPGSESSERFKVMERKLLRGIINPSMVAVWILGPLLASDAAFAAANALILRNTTLVNFLDGCAVSLPIHHAGEAPVGLSLACPGGHDARLLSLALALEQTLTRAAP